MTEIRRVLITGANKGIGRATVAAVLSAASDTHVLLGSRDAGRGQAARAALLAEEPGWEGRLEVVAIDVGDDDSVTAAADHVRSRFPDEERPLYGIINNAGIGFGADMTDILNVNVFGPHRVCTAFLSLLQSDGRIVMVSSASGPSFVAGCDSAHQTLLTKPEVTWSEVEGLMQKCLELDASGGDFGAAGLGDGAYGLSKACLNAYMMHLARENPGLTINACTPGFIETDLTRHYAESQGVAPSELGMKTPLEGTKASLHLLLGEPGGSGWYFGSDAVRSPIDRYRAPGDPPYTGE